MTKSIKKRVKEFFSPKGAAWLLSPGLSERGEEHTIRTLEQYASIISKGVSHFKDAVEAYERANEVKFKLSFEEIVSMWEDAERIRKDVFDHLVQKKLFFPDSREDMLRLIHKLDRILLIIRDAHFVILPHEPLSNSLSTRIDDVAKSCEEAADLLSLSVTYLNKEPSRVATLYSRVVDIEIELFSTLESARQEIAAISNPDIRFETTEFFWKILEVYRTVVDAIRQVQEIAIKFL